MNTPSPPPLSLSGVLRTAFSHENLELTNVFPLKAWDGSEYRYASFSHCRECLLCPPWSNHLYFLQNIYFLIALIVTNAVSRVGPRNRIGHSIVTTD